MQKNYRSSAVLLSLALVGAIAFTLSFAGTIATYAQEPQGPPPHGEHGPPHHRGPNAEFETKMLTKRLGLSEQQAAAVEPILAQQDESLKALRPAPGTQPDFKAMQQNRKAIMESTKQQLAGVFTADQLAEFDKMHAHHGPPGGGPGGPHGNWQGKPAPTSGA